jgi:hypothetical protein
MACQSRVWPETSISSLPGAISLTPIQIRSTPPAILSHGSSSSATANTVSTMRSKTAAALPQNTASFCWSGGSERAASAIMTALSPETSRLIQMIAPSSTQNMG